MGTKQNREDWILYDPFTGSDKSIKLMNFMVGENFRHKLTH